MQSAFTIAVLGDMAKRQPLLHKAPAPNRAGGRVEQVPGAIRIDVALLADDKIIAVMKGDVIYGNYTDISQLSEAIINRLKHYFLTYKDMPGSAEKRMVEISAVYGREEACEVIHRSIADYKNRFPDV